METTYLIMVGAEANNNKFYRMIPSGDSFTVEYGRVGASGFQTTTYPLSKWNSLYSSKVKKGYRDVSKLSIDIVPEKKSEYVPITNQIVAEIVNRLQQMARKTIADNYTVASTKVTQAMIDEAQVLLNGLLSIDSVELFNAKLLELFSVIPRKMSRVADFLAKRTEDFVNIIKKEQDLLDVMKGQVVEHTADEEAESHEVTILETMGLEFTPVDDSDVQIIKAKLRGQSYRYYNAWKIVNKKTQQRFDNFVKENGIACTELLFHGSRNENFWSIIGSGLMIRPSNAVYTGSMFGDAIYFANDAGKSLGYSSLSGSRWTGGSSNFGFLALFDTAYGNPYFVYDFNSRFYNFNYQKLQQCQANANCLHASASRGMLRCDEIVFYKPEQATIQYLVEMR